jgi:hypothetical protein
MCGVRGDDGPSTAIRDRDEIASGGVLLTGPSFIATRESAMTSVAPIQVGTSSPAPRPCPREKRRYHQLRNVVHVCSDCGTLKLSVTQPGDTVARQRQVAWPPGFSTATESAMRGGGVTDDPM